MKVSATIFVIAMLGFGLCALVDRTAYKSIGERAPHALALIGLLSFFTIPVSAASMFLCAIWDIA